MPAPNHDILDPADAARLLGVTPELLFAYALRPPKTHLGHDRTLKFVCADGREGFQRAELLEFNAYLQEPWSDLAANRPTIPTCVTEYLKVESGGQCARCGKGFKLQNAHIEPWADSLSHYHHNLIRLCSHCHELFDTKRLILTAEIRAIKERLVAGVRERLSGSPSVVCGATTRVPNPSSVFVGREQELDAVLEALREKRTVAILGPGGIGKTQLLLHALRWLPEGRQTVWIDVGAYGGIHDVELALSAAASSLGFPPACHLIDQIANADVRIVLDGVERMSPHDMDDMEDFINGVLRMTTAPHLVLTSQAELYGVDADARIAVLPLDTDACKLLLQPTVHSIQSVTEQSAFKWLIAFCEGHPLTIRLVAGLLRHFKSASVVARRIGENGSSAVEQPARRRHTSETSLSCSLRVSWQSLDNSQQRVLWVVSHCPAGCRLVMLTRNGAYGIRDADADVAELVRWHLLSAVVDEALAETRIEMLSPVRAFVQSEWKDGADTKELRELHVEWVSDMALQAVAIRSMHFHGEDAAYGIYRFAREFPNLIRAFNYAAVHASKDERYAELVGPMASSMMVFCFVNGQFERGASIMRRAAEEERRLGNVQAASDLLLNWSVLAQRSDDVAAVRRAAAELECMVEATDEPSLNGNAAMVLGALALSERRLKDAEGHFTRAVCLFEQIMDVAPEADTTGRGDSRHMLAMALMQQGFVTLAQDCPEEALPLYERALSMIVEDQDPVNFPSVLHQIGNCTADSDPVRALACYIGAAGRFQLMGASEHLSNSLAELGHLMINWDPPVPVGWLITRDLLADGLTDLADETVRAFTAGLSNSKNQCLKVMRKVMGLLALASFSADTDLLAGFVRGIRELVLIPLLRDIGFDTQQKDAVTIMYLDLMLALCGSVSDVQQPNGYGQHPSLDEVEHYARICYRFFDWGWVCLSPFEWLATYLRRHRGLAQATAPLLRGAAIAAEEEGRPFSIMWPAGAGALLWMCSHRPFAV